ncbi:Prp5 [Kluyveromyces lactis]|nr:Prp5 [Kluyveromyces lactis]
MDPKEKLRIRQEKLAKWKKQKLNNDVTASVPVDAKEERLKKLETWKKKKKQQDELKQRDIKLTSIKSVDSDRNKRRAQCSRKRPAFGISDSESDDEISTSTLFKPRRNDTKAHVLTKDNSKDDLDDGNDALDEYIHKLIDKDSNTNRVRLIDSISEDEDANGSSSEKTISQEEAPDDAEISFKKKGKKKIKAIDYSKVLNLITLNKCLYREPNNLGLMSEKDVEELRLSLDNIKISGKDCPKPVTKWSQLGLSSEIMDLISNELQFVTLTPIQCQAVPAIMSGRDVIGISKTGSGKTVAFLLPLVRQIKAQPPLAPDETGPIGLILTPTRELAVQIQEEALKFSKGSGISSICCVGGSELKQQINELKRGVDIIVATPGRFIDLMTLNSGHLLSPTRISFVVMDEADRLFDLGFGPQVNQIMGCIRPDKQCVLFSATFPSKLKHFASRTLKNPIQITINSKSLINENIQQRVQIFDEEHVKFEFLLKRLSDRLALHRGEDEKTIIFVGSQQLCDLLYDELLLNGITTFPIHAGKPSAERLRNLQKFKETDNGILICTEVLSRGLNVPEVSLVIIYNAAKTIAQYVHTVGRTGRGTNNGVALSFIMVDELASAYILVKCMKENELSSLPMIVYQKLKEMNDEFSNGLKTGKYRLIQGFGGKGLDHLDELTEAKQSQEYTDYGAVENEEEATEEENGATKMEYTRGKREEGNSTTYFAHININDLPQLARWEATKTETVSNIKQETGCNFESKGIFYPEGKGPKNDTDDPKLYLIVEGAEESDVTMALELLNIKVKEGIRKTAVKEIQSGKYRM